MPSSPLPSSTDRPQRARKPSSDVQRRRNVPVRTRAAAEEGGFVWECRPLIFVTAALAAVFTAACNVRRSVVATDVAQTSSGMAIALAKTIGDARSTVPPACVRRERPRGVFNKI